MMECRNVGIYLVCRNVGIYLGLSNSNFSTRKKNFQVSDNVE